MTPTAAVITTDTFFKDTHKSCNLLDDYRPDITLCVPCEFLQSPLLVKTFIELKAYALSLEDNEKGEICFYLAKFLCSDPDRKHVTGALYNGVSFILVHAAYVSNDERNKLRQHEDIKFRITEPIALAGDRQEKLFLRFLLASDATFGFSEPKLAEEITRKYDIMQRLGAGVSAVVERLVEKANHNQQCVIKRFHYEFHYDSERANLEQLSEAKKRCNPAGFCVPNVLIEDDEHLALVMSPVCHPATDFNVPMTQKSLFALIDFVKWCAEEANLVHYDLRSDNIMYVQVYGSYKVCVVDWTHAYAVGKREYVGGTVSTAHPDILDHIQRQQPGHGKLASPIRVTPKHSLHSVVRHAYLSLFTSANSVLRQRLEFTERLSETYFAEVRAFWSKELSSGSWCDIITAIDKSDGGSTMYDALKAAFKPVFSGFPTFYRYVDVVPGSSVSGLFYRDFKELRCGLFLASFQQ